MEEIALIERKKIGVNEENLRLTGTEQVEFFLGNEKVAIDVKRHIPYSEAAAWMSCFTELSTDLSGRYVPELFEYAIRYATVRYFTNADIDGLELDESWALLFSHEYEKILSIVQEGLLWKSLLAAAYERVQAMRRADESESVNVAAENLAVVFDKLSALLDTVMDAVAKANVDDAPNIKDIVDAAKKLNGADIGKVVAAVLESKGKDRSEKKE